MPTDPRKLQIAYEEFAGAFLHPLLTGGSVRIGKPVAPGMLEHFALARPSDMEIDRALFDRLHDDASELAPLRALPWPDRGTTALAMAAYDLVTVTDPALDRWLGRRARSAILGWVDFFIAQAGAPRTRGEALMRHGVLGRALELRRQDVVAQNWGFTHRYLGRPVPDGFFTRPRWVSETQSRPDVLELWKELDEELDLTSRLAALLARSPVTQLLRMDVVPDVTLGTAALAVLSDDLLRNGIARRLVAQGADVMTPLGSALRTLAQRRPPPRLLFYPLALIYEMHVIAIMDAREGRQPVFSNPDSPDARLFLAVLPAMVGAPDDLGALLDLDPDDLRTVRRHAGRLDGAAGPEAGAQAVALVDLAEPPRLDHERESAPAGGLAPAHDATQR